MATFSAITVYLCENAFEGSNPAACAEVECTPLCLRLYRLLMDSLLDSPQSFRHTIRNPGLSLLHLDWIGIGQTSGVAMWVRRGKIDAASILLNGIEDRCDFYLIQRIFAAEDVPLAQTVVQRIAVVDSPMMITLHYTPRGRKDKVVAAASNALAVAYFGMFGLCQE